MKIRQLPSGAWTTQVQVNGVRRSFTHKSKTQLRKMSEAYRQNASDVPRAPLGVLIDNYSIEAECPLTVHCSTL